MALYDTLGVGYARRRRPDPRIAAQVEEALGDARRVLNVGAGSGSYEPAGRTRVAVEPSARMVAQRPAGSAPAVRAVAEALPFADGAFDGALAVLTLHHWTEWRRGAAEMRRVAHGPVVFLTWDAWYEHFWLVRDYFPGVLEVDRPRFPSFDEMAGVLGPVDVRPVPVPAECEDGFLGAYWRRPEAYLDAEARAAISVLAAVPDSDPRLARLRADLADGTWERRNGHLRVLSELDVGYRLVVAGA